MSKRYTLSIIDEATSNAGSGQQDVVLSFDVNGDGAISSMDASLILQTENLLIF